MISNIMRKATDLKEFDKKWNRLDSAIVYVDIRNEAFDGLFTSIRCENVLEMVMDVKKTSFRPDLCHPLRIDAKEERSKY